MPVFDPIADRSALAATLAAGDKRLVACLCAAWCGTCREYRESLDRLAVTHPHLCFVWIDIESHDDWLDDHDIENFPTLLVQDAGGGPVRFFGPLLPAIGVLQRMLDDAVLGDKQVDAPDLHAHLSAWVAGAGAGTETPGV